MSDDQQSNGNNFTNDVQGTEGSDWMENGEEAEFTSDSNDYEDESQDSCDDEMDYAKSDDYGDDLSSEQSTVEDDWKYFRFELICIITNVLVIR